MFDYVRKSLEKFRQDVLSKLFYDILKWLIPAVFIFAGTKVLPIHSSFSDFISTKIDISLYALILIVLGGINLTIILVSIAFNGRYKVLQKDNFTDEVTGLANHKALKKYLPEKISESNKNGKTISIILIDVDDFKSFNTRYGGPTADNILAKVGQLLSNDKRITDETFRQYLRGDEFIVVASETSLNEASTAAERKRRLIESTGFIVDERTYHLTVSCGVTELKKNSDNEDSIINRAFHALTEAKNNDGKNCTRMSI